MTMRKTIKRLIALGIVTITATGLMACGSKEEAATNGPVELKIATWANEREAKEFDDVLSKVNSSQDKYKLTQMVIPKDYYVKIQTMTSGNQAPDLFWLAQEYIPAYAENGAIVDINDKLANQSKVDMNDYLPGSLDTAKYKDKTYGLPWIGQPYVVYYNKSMFKDAGITEPTMNWNWNEFYNDAKKLTKNGNYGFATTGSLPTAIFTWGEGGDIVAKDGTVTLDSPESIEGLKVATKIMTDTSATMPYQEAKSLGVEQGFVDGKIAMMVGGANDDVERKVREAGEKFEVGMAVMPAGSKNHVTFNWTASTVMSSQSKNQDVAFEALLDITNAMTEWKVPSAFKSKVEKIGDINPDKKYALDVISKSSEISRGFNNVVQQNEIGGIQWQNLDEVILSNNNGKGGINVESMAKSVADELRGKIK
ncbi:ABC transporter substrate-binding protein [Clostridium sp.]|uniref:ABC transporter substrate-binding protein n=1 Tax=Clostridium sp. TaxID=1506 RepID=UPI003463D205